MVEVGIDLESSFPAMARTLVSLKHRFIDAMLALLNERGAWSDGRERRVSELLGYEAWQMDYWMTHRHSLANG
jgi:hypothetical protein